MADADSLHEQNSDLENDPSAIDADAEDESIAASEGTKRKSKKKKRSAKDAAASAQVARSSGDSDSALATEEIKAEQEASNTGPSEQVLNEASRLTKERQIQGLAKLMEQMQFQSGTPKNLEDAKKKKYQFWDTQPVPKLDQQVVENEAIEPDKEIRDVRQEPYSLPEGFQWDTLNLHDPLVLKELYTLLNENYVEDDDNMFRFDYSSQFLLWCVVKTSKTN